MILSMEIPANPKRVISLTIFGWSTTLINIDAISVKHDQRNDNRINDESLIIIIINAAIKQRAERSRALIRAVQPHATLSTKREVTSSLTRGRSPRTVLEPHRFSRDPRSRVRERFPCSYPLFHFIWRPSRPVASHEQNVRAIVARTIRYTTRRDRPSAILRRGKATIFVVLSISEFLSSVLFAFSLSLSFSFIFSVCILRARSSTHPENRRGAKETAVLKIDKVPRERDPKNVKDDLLREFDDTWLSTGAKFSNFILR